MLSDSLQELLSAYVDGELAPAEYERVMAALRDSAVARDYVKQLRDMSAQIKGLPQLSTPTSFAAHYLKHDQKIRSRKKAWRWGAVAAAAAALITGVSMWLTRPEPVVPGPALGGMELAQKPGPVTPNPAHTTLPPVQRPADPTWLADLGKQAAAWSLEQLDKATTQINDTAGYLASIQRDLDLKAEEHRKTLLTERPKDPFVLKSVELDYAPTINTDQFSLDTLQKHWGKKGLFVADLQSTDTIKTLTRLTEACQQHGIKLVLDEDVQRRLKGRLPATFMVYLENVPETTVAQLWTTLDQLDHWRSNVSAADASCRSINFAAADVDQRKHYARSLGVTVEKLSPKASTTAPSKQGVVLTYFPNRLPESISPNVRQILNGQPGPKPDAVSLLFLVRGSK